MNSSTQGLPEPELWGMRELVAVGPNQYKFNPSVIEQNTIVSYMEIGHKAFLASCGQLGRYGECFLTPNIRPSSDWKKEPTAIKTTDAVDVGGLRSTIGQVHQGKYFFGRVHSAFYKSPTASGLMGILHEYGGDKGVRLAFGADYLEKDYELPIVGQIGIVRNPCLKATGHESEPICLWVDDPEDFTTITLAQFKYIWRDHGFDFGHDDWAWMVEDIQQIYYSI